MGEGHGSMWGREQFSGHRESNRLGGNAFTSWAISPTLIFSPFLYLFTVLSDDPVFVGNVSCNALHSSLTPTTVLHLAKGFLSLSFPKANIFHLSLHFPSILFIPAPMFNIALYWFGSWFSSSLGSTKGLQLKSCCCLMNVGAGC